MDIRRIEPKQTYDFILHKHYAQRKPSISFAFGLFVNDVLEGVLTIGKPASPSLCNGICGKEFSSKVYELNRLCVNEGMPKNTLSKFVSTALRMLKNENLIIASYADKAMSHCGFIYQATNWIYTGKTKARTDKWTAGGRHSRHYDKNAEEVFRKFRSSKHRYVYFTNNKKKYLKSLNYPILPYPKLDSKRYVLGEKIKEKIINVKTKEVFYE